MNDVRLVYENGVPNIQKKLWYADDNSEISLANFEAGDRIYSINDDELYQVEYDTSTEQEYSGEIVSFEADEDDRISSLEIEINPVQDLHGQNAPYPPGGRVNILDATKDITFTTNITYSLKSIPSGTTVYVYRDDYVYTTEPSSGSKYPMAVFRDSDGNMVGSIWVLPKTQTGKVSSVVLTGEAVQVQIWSNGYDWAASSGVEITIKGIVVGLTEPVAWSPYSNECPISGWTGCKVMRTGKNLLDFTVRSASGITTTKENGVAKISGTASATVYPIDFVAVDLESGIYTISVYGLTTGLTCAYSKNGAWAANVTDSITFTLTSKATITGYVRVSNGTANVNASVKIQIEKASSATEWESFGETIPVSWQTEAGTVYDCTLELTTGVLTVTHKTTIADGTNLHVEAIYSNGTAYTNNIPDIYDDSTYARQREILIKSDKLNGSSYIDCVNTPYGVSQNGGRRLVFNLPGLTTVTEFNTWLQTNTPTILYELATPVTYQLDPVTINLLLGQNNIWTNTGDTTVKIVTNNKALFKLNPHF